MLPEEVLVAALGNAAGHHLHALAWNRDERPVEPIQVAKSVGHEETFPVDVVDRALLERELVRLADGVATRLRAASVTGRTVQLKVRYGDFRTISRARTLREPTAVASDIAQVARVLLRDVPTHDGIRLLGVSVSKLGTQSVVQPRLFDLFDSGGAADPSGLDPQRSARLAAVEESVDAVRARFGTAAVGQVGFRRQATPIGKFEALTCVDESGPLRDNGRARRYEQASESRESCRSPRTNSGSCRRSKTTCLRPTPSWCSRPTSRSIAIRRA